MDFRDFMIFGQSDGGTFGSFEDSAVLGVHRFGGQPTSLTWVKLG